MKTNKHSAPRRPSTWYATGSMALVLMLLGVFGLLVLFLNSIIRAYRESIPVVVELKNEARPSQIESLQALIAASRYAKSGSVQFITKEEAAVMMEEQFGDFREALESNPLRNVLEFRLHPRYANADSLQTLKNMLQQQSIVEDVTADEVLVNQIANNLRRISTAALLMGLFFMLVVITLINNTVRLNLYANRLTIKTMQLVGATEKFISSPYIRQAAIQGIIASTLAILLLVALLVFFYRQLPELAQMEPSWKIASLFTLLAFIGVGIPALSASLSVRRFLAARLHELQ